MLLTVLLSSFLMSVMADKPHGQSLGEPLGPGNVISVGEWVTVRDNTQGPWVDPVTEVDSGLGLAVRPLLRWGLGSIIIMLIISTALSLGQKLLPNIVHGLMALQQNAATGRSLDNLDMTSLAQYAFEAFEKYATMNEE